MAIEDILLSIRESHDAAKEHLLSQAEYETGQILARKKASLEEWKAKEEKLWEEKLTRERKNQRAHVEILAEQEKKRLLYESARALYEETIKTVLAHLKVDKKRYQEFLANSVRQALQIWNTKEMIVFVASEDVGVVAELEKLLKVKLSPETGRAITGGVICRYQQEEIDFSFEQIQESLRSEMIQWLYQQMEGSKNAE